MTPRIVAHQAPLSMEFSRQEYWSVEPFPSPGDLPDPGIKTRSPALPADSSLVWATRKAHINIYVLFGINFLAFLKDILDDRNVSLITIIQRQTIYSTIIHPLSHLN